MEPSEARAHAFVSDLEVPALDPSDHHHLERVLRLRAGEPVTVSDGAGRWRACRWTAIGGLAADGGIVVDDPPAPEVTVGLALTKGERPEWAVQKLTELGVDRIRLLAADRSVVRWHGGRRAGHIERLRRVAREAAMQSRRTRLPDVGGVVAFAELVDVEGSGVAMAQRGGDPPSLDHPTVLVGPEGGWSPEELSCGLPAVGLGGTVLRAETAAVVAGAVLCGLRAGVISAVRGHR